MKPFEYAQARSTAGARELAGRQGSYLAGGTDLLGEMKEYLVSPKRVIDIKTLPGSAEIVPRKTDWTIGTNVKIAAIANHPGLQDKLPGLAEAAAYVGSPQIRNVATVGGNLAQHSRCWYYRHRDIKCLKNGGFTCYAREGESKHHCLFSGNPCISPVVSNLAIALTALAATVTVENDKGRETLPVEELYGQAWFNPIAHNSLQPSDLIIDVRIPTRSNSSAYIQASEKAIFDWALVSCAAAARVEGRRLFEPRVVLGAISPIPHQVQSANELLHGKTLDRGLADEVAEMILQDAQPTVHNAYKIPLAKTLIRRTLLQLIT